MTFFSNFANDSQMCHRVGIMNPFLQKGVIEILSSIIELGGLKFHEDKVGNSTCTDCIFIPYGESALSVWGYCFIRGKVRQDLIMG